MMRLGCSRTLMWANIMNTSEFEQANLTQQGFTGNLGTASLPDEGHLTQLANALFSALPCDGSRLGLDASAVPGGLSSTLAGFGQSGVTGITPQGFGPPGVVELQQVFAPRKPSFESVPDSLDTGPVLGNPSSAPGLTSPLAGLDKAALAGIFAHGFVQHERAQLFCQMAEGCCRRPERRGFNTLCGTQCTWGQFGWQHRLGRCGHHNTLEHVPGVWR